jgi:hypothetical protein
MLVLSWPLSSNSRYKSKNDADEAVSHTGVLMTFYLSTILDLQNFFHRYILQSWKLKRPQIQLRPHHFWTYTSNLTTVSILTTKVNVKNTITSHIDKNIFDIVVDFLIFIHFHSMKIHRSPLSLQRQNIFRQYLGIGIWTTSILKS